MVMAPRRVRHDIKQNEMKKQELKSGCVRSSKKTRVVIKALSSPKGVLVFGNISVYHHRTN